MRFHYHFLHIARVLQAEGIAPQVILAEARILADEQAPERAAAQVRQHPRLEAQHGQNAGHIAARLGADIAQEAEPARLLHLVGELIGDQEAAEQQQQVAMEQGNAIGQAPVAIDGLHEGIPIRDGQVAGHHELQIHVDQQQGQQPEQMNEGELHVRMVERRQLREREPRREGAQESHMKCRGQLLRLRLLYLCLRPLLLCWLLLCLLHLLWLHFLHSVCLRPGLCPALYCAIAAVQSQLGANPIPVLPDERQQAGAAEGANA